MAVTRFKYEREVLQKGILRVAGADEARRGPLAAPVVEAALCLALGWIQNGIPRKLFGLKIRPDWPSVESIVAAAVRT